MPYEFRNRVAGKSKLSALVGLDFLGLVVHHATAGSCRSASCSSRSSAESA